MSGPIVQEFDTYAAYRAALLDAIGRAEREILIFDPDLGETGLESPHAAEALQRFLLHASGRDCLRAVLADTTRLDRNSPRLLRLLGSYGHKFAVRIVSHDDPLRALPQPFAIIDRRHLVTRFHEEHPRGKACFDDPATCAPFFAQFETIWIDAQPAQSGAVLGL
jgi:hypothetical protein